MPGEFVLTLKFDKSYEFKETKEFSVQFSFSIHHFEDKKKFKVISGLSKTFCDISETFSFSNSVIHFKEKIR